MAEMNFGGVMETVVTSHEFSLEKAREVLKNETIAVTVMVSRVLVRLVTFAIMVSMSSLDSVRVKPMRSV